MIAFAGPGKREPVVEPLASVLATLAAEYKTPISAEANLAPYLVYFEPHGACLNSCLQTLASALHATVVPKEAGLSIVRTKADIQGFVNQRTALRKQGLQRSLDFIAKNREQLGTTNTSIVARRKAEDAVMDARSHGENIASDNFFANLLLPSALYLPGLISAIGIEKIASIPDGEQEIFEDFPTAEAQLLPNHRALDDTFVAAQARISPLPDRGFPYNLGRFGQTLEHPDEDYLAQPAAKVRVTVSADVSNTTVGIQGFRQNGQSAFSTMAEGYLGKLVGWPGPIEQSLMSKPNARWIEFSPGALDVVHFLGSDHSETLPDWMKRPDRIEPMNLFVKEALHVVAEENPDKCVAISVSDDLWEDLLTSSRRTKFLPAAFEWAAGIYSGYQFEKNAFGVAWRSNMFLPSRNHQENRTVIANDVNKILSEGAFTIRGKALLCFDTSPSSTFRQVWINKIGRLTSIRQASGSFEESSYRLLGSISDAFWEKLKSGQPLTVGQLGIEDEFGRFLRKDRVNVQGSQGVSDLLSHPNELYTNESLFSTPIQFFHSTRPILNEFVQGSPQSGTSVDVYGPVSEQTTYFRGAHPKAPKLIRENWEKLKQELFGYRLGSYEKDSIQIRFPGNYFVQYEIDSQVVLSPTIYRYSDLPPQLRDAFWEHHRQETLNIKYVDMNERNNQTPVESPPPPR